MSSRNSHTGFSLPAGNFTLDNTPEDTVEILMISEELEDSEKYYSLSIAKCSTGQGTNSSLNQMTC